MNYFVAHQMSILMLASQILAAQAGACTMSSSDDNLGLLRSIAQSIDPQADLSAEAQECQKLQINARTLKSDITRMTTEDSRIAHLQARQQLLEAERKMPDSEAQLRAFYSAKLRTRTIELGQFVNQFTNEQAMIAVNAFRDYFRSSAEALRTEQPGMKQDAQLDALGISNFVGGFQYFVGIENREQYRPNLERIQSMSGREFTAYFHRHVTERIERSRIVLETDLGDSGLRAIAAKITPRRRASTRVF